MRETGVSFDPSTGVTVPESENIRSAIAADWTSAFFTPGLPALNTEPSSPAGQLIDAEVAEIEAKNAALLFVANQFNPKVNSGIWQDAIGYIYFINRKLDEPTVVTCQLTGISGTQVPYGALVGDANGNTLICNRAVSIGTGGTAETTFRVSVTGPVEVGPGTVTKIITTVPGWDTVTNSAAGAVGRDLETRSEFEARRALSVAANAHGSVGAIFGTLANIPGVLDIAVLENIGPEPVVQFGVSVPGHGITVCVYGGDDAEIARGIYAKKDAGADTGGNTEVVYTDTLVPGSPVYRYAILRPDPVNFWVQVTLGSGNAVTGPVETAMRQAIFDDFYGLSATSGNSRVGLAQDVYASRFFCSVLVVEGVRNVRDIQIALSGAAPASFTDMIRIQGDQEPVLSLSNISIVQGG